VLFPLYFLASFFNEVYYLKKKRKKRDRLTYIASLQPRIEQEPSNPPKKSAVETHNFDYLHVPKINDKEGKENSKSHQAIKGESETWISYNGRAYPSKPAEDSTKILGTMVRTIILLDVSFLN